VEAAFFLLYTVIRNTMTFNDIVSKRAGERFVSRDFLEPSRRTPQPQRDRDKRTGVEFAQKVPSFSLCNCQRNLGLEVDDEGIGRAI
jgi:hypothetical protein